MVFGLDRVDFSSSIEPIKAKNFTIDFEHLKTPARFQDYDIVVFLQGIFETFQWSSSPYSEGHWIHSCHRNELDQRSKELALLLQRGGMFCSLLVRTFIDRDNGQDFRYTDLTKRLLNYTHLKRSNFSNRVPHLEVKQSEFARFFELYGAANSYFEIHDKELPIKTIASVNNYPVSLRINDNSFFIPSLGVPKHDEKFSEYFSLLVDGLTSIKNKLHREVPEWARKFAFAEEESYKGEISALQTRIGEIQARLDRLDSFKSSLTLTGEPLVQVVSEILQEVTGFNCDSTDELKEDAKLKDENEKIVAICEIKGVNRGIKRENINQTDSHRDRSGFAESFPALLIANTAIKNANNLQEKDEEPSADQIIHAAKINILILRTLDLLNLLRLIRSGEVEQVEARRLLLENSGWLKVSAAGVEVRKQ